VRAQAQLKRRRFGRERPQLGRQHAQSVESRQIEGRPASGSVGVPREPSWSPVRSGGLRRGCAAVRAEPCPDPEDLAGAREAPVRLDEMSGAGGEALAVRCVGGLEPYTPGERPDVLLTDTRIVHYPLQTGTEARATVSMALSDGQWRMLSVGNAERTTAFFRAVRTSARVLKQGEGEPFAVRVPALNVEFVETRDAQNGLLLTPIADDPRWHLKAGVAEPAAVVFSRLVASAKSHDGLPR
jgi:hypothetical protein